MPLVIREERISTSLGWKLRFISSSFIIKYLLSTYYTLEVPLNTKRMIIYETDVLANLVSIKKKTSKYKSPNYDKLYEKFYEKGEHGDTAENIGKGSTRPALRV